MLTRECLRAAKADAPPLSERYTISLALGPNIRFELCQGPKQVEHQLAL